ncbi:MAG TPA: hypothetical protein VGE76_12610, partial [Opitutaceae bacterium]
MSLTRFAVIACCLALLVSLRAQDYWTPDAGVPTTSNLWSVAYGDHTLVAAGELGTLLTYSYEDKAWTVRASGNREWLVGAAYGNGRFIVVGDFGIILTSDDSGATWTPRVSGTTIRLNNVAYGNSRWVAVGEQGVLLTSADGTTWESRPALGTGFLRALAHGQGRWLIGGARGALYTTTDLQTFTRVELSTTEDIESAAISASRYWIVGSKALRATATSLGAWTMNPGLAGQGTLRGVVVRNQTEASAVGDRNAFTYYLLPGGNPGWGGVLQAPRFLATAVTQGLDELVSVGFGGAVARTQTDSQAYLASETGRKAIYGSEVRYRVVTAFTPTSYQWTHNDIPLAGETGAELVLRNVKPPTHAGGYAVRMTTAQGREIYASTFLEIVAGGRPEVRDATYRPALPSLPSLAVPQPDGKLLVAGPFSIATAVGSTYGLARLERDGSIDTGFRAGDGIGELSSISDILLTSDGRIYVSGSFSRFAGQPRPGLARLLPNGALDVDFAPAGVSFPGKIALAPDGRLLAELYTGGRDIIVRLNRDGTRDMTLPDLESNRLIGVDSQGRILAQRPNPGGRPILTRYLANGTRDTSYRETILQDNSREDFEMTRIVGDALYSSSTFAFLTYHKRYLPNGGIDLTYEIPGLLVISRSYSATYLSDGTLVRIEGGITYFHTPEGRPDPARYASLPGLDDYTLLAGTVSGSLYVIPRTAYATTPQELVRINVLSGRIGRLTNLSVRAQASAAEPLIAGFVTGGSAATSALIRAVGPGLTPYGVTNGMADPRLTLTRNGANLAENDNWPAALAQRFAALGAFPLTSGS